MKKTTKGAVAAAASATLLVGGAGSLAYWNTTDDVTAGQFTTGDLALDFDDCDNAKWVLTNTIEGSTNNDFNIATGFLVPGDVVTKSCEIPITAVGENLRANFAITGGGETFSPGLIDGDDVNVTSTFRVGDDAQTAAPTSFITDANNDDVVFVKIEVAFPITGADDGVDAGGNPLADDGSKNQTVTVTDYVVTATQVRS